LVRKALTLLRNPRGVYHKYKSKLVRLFGGVAPIYGEDYDSHWGFTNFKGKTVLDLGADYGSTARYFLRRGARRVVAVEGDPRLAEELEENFRGDGRVVPIHLFIEGTEQVAELIERFDPDLVKVDIEGAEKVLLDLPRGLVKGREWLVEVHSDELYERLKRLFLECGLGVRAFLYSNGLKIIHARRFKPFELKSALRARQCLPRRSSLEGVCLCFKMFCDALQPYLLKHQSLRPCATKKRVLRARGLAFEGWAGYSIFSRSWEALSMNLSRVRSLALSTALLE
jgi:SAM-dependent methyltransferase